MLDADLEHRLHQLVAERKFEAVRSLAIQGFRRALVERPDDIPHIMLILAASYFATRHYERSLFAVDQALEWAHKVSSADDLVPVKALTIQAAAQWNLGNIHEGLKTAMESVRQLRDGAEPAVRFESLANAGRMCLRMGSGDMAALFARQAWETYRNAIPVTHPYDRFYTAFHYTIPMCLIAERGQRRGLAQLLDEVRFRMAIHLTPVEIAVREAFVEYHLRSAERRLSSAQRALDELFALVDPHTEDGLWYAYGMIAQSHLHLDLGRPAHALQSAESARATAARYHRLDLEGEALSIWYQAYRKTGLPHRSVRSDIEPAVLPLERRVEAQSETCK